MTKTLKLKIRCLDSTWISSRAPYYLKKNKKNPTILQQLCCVFLESIAEIQGDFMEHNITQHTDNTS